MAERPSAMFNRVRAHANAINVVLDEHPWRTLWIRSPLQTSEWEAIAVWLDRVESGQVIEPWPPGIYAVDNQPRAALRQLSDMLLKTGLYT